MKIKRRNFFLELLIGIVAIYLIVLIFLFFFQRNLMYHPDENNYSGDTIFLRIYIPKNNFPRIFHRIPWNSNKITESGPVA